MNCRRINARTQVLAGPGLYWLAPQWARATGRLGPEHAAWRMAQQRPDIADAGHSVITVLGACHQAAFRINADGLRHLDRQNVTKFSS